MNILSFSFGHSGMSMDDCYSYSVTQESDGAHLQAELFAGNKVVDVVIDEPILEELGEIAQRNRLDKWDGFHKINDTVLDGDGFSLFITLSDERTISASGSNTFPDGYGAAMQEICALFDALIDEYGNLYPKTLTSNELDYIMLYFTKRGGKEFFCSAREQSDGTVSLNIRISGYEDFYPQDEYKFFGSCKNFPFDELQPIVRKYDIPSWNGWDKTAENYEECEWFQIEFGYENGESIFAMGTLYPENYNDVRSEMLAVIVDFIARGSGSFIPGEG